jgi:hypothetical protein
MIEDALRRVREAWNRGQPAVLSTHRANYAHLESGRAAASRGALRDLLQGLVAEGAVFLVDAEVRELQERSWSVRPVGERGALVRYFGVPGVPIRFPAPAGLRQVSIREGRGPGEADARLEGPDVVARLNVGEYLLEWGRA